jgi:DNA-binding response OmpR family regulator
MSSIGSLPRILVVDDDADMRETLRVLLRHMGYDAEGAFDGNHALQIQRVRPAGIVITDIFMPRKDGIETIEAFRREWPRVKIVAMSGGGAVATRDYLGLAPDIGADAVLRKPFSPESLEELLTKL